MAKPNLDPNQRPPKGIVTSPRDCGGDEMATHFAADYADYKITIPGASMADLKKGYQDRTDMGRETKSDPLKDA